MPVLALAIAGGIALAFGLWFWWACSIPTSRFFRPALIRGPQTGKRICLTFDDGPASPFTERILDVLHAHAVPAAFFLCGANVEGNPDLARRIAAEGHEIGNHTYSHPFLYFKSRQRMAQEIDRTQSAIEKATGRRPKVFRPPFGARWFGLIPTLRERGLQMVMWSATGYDWKKDARGIVASALKELRPGAILLLHDGAETTPQDKVDRSRTIAALPEIIRQARARGYTFVALKDFLAAS